VAFVDNDKLSIKCDEILAKLFSSFGEEISFKRAYLNTSDPRLRELIDVYKVGACPTVLLFDDQGKIYKKYMVFVSPDQLAQDIAAIAVDRSHQHFGNSHDERVSRFRSEQLSDVYRRISEGERNLTSKIQAIDEDIQSKKDQLAQYQTGSRRIVDSYDRADLQQSVITQERNKQALLDNFEKQKNEWFGLAEQRIEAMESTR
jgi:thioredoxin-related protein